MFGMHTLESSRVTVDFSIPYNVYYYSPTEQAQSVPWLSSPSVLWPHGTHADLSEIATSDAPAQEVQVNPVLIRTRGGGRGHDTGSSS